MKLKVPTIELRNLVHSYTLMIVLFGVWTTLEFVTIMHVNCSVICKWSATCVNGWLFWDGVLLMLKLWRSYKRNGPDIENFLKLNTYHSICNKFILMHITKYVASNLRHMKHSSTIQQVYITIFSTTSNNVLWNTNIQRERGAMSLKTYDLSPHWSLNIVF